MSYEPDGREPVDCLDLEDRPEPPTERSDGWDERYPLEAYYEGRAEESEGPSKDPAQTGLVR